MKRFSELLFLLLVLLITAFMFVHPQAAYEGACRGLETWAIHLLPSLLPFFIAADLLLSMGFVRFLGVLLEPVMRPLFRLPGEAGFAVALGFTSGFPMGAVLTASLKEQHLCTSQEAARLAAFTNNSSPLFLLISVPVSMLHQPRLGVLLLAAHYLANLTIGFLLRFTAPPVHCPVLRHRLFHTAFTQMRQYQIQHHQPAGAMLGQAVQKGIDGIVKIGGFVLLFSVLLSLLQASGILSIMQMILAFLLNILNLSPKLAAAISAGLFEMTLGAQFASESNAPLLEQLMIISFILGWSGFSIQAQVSSILATQGISSKLYCLCRPLQGFLAALYIPVLITLFPGILSVHTADNFIESTISPYVSTPDISLLLSSCYLLFAAICILLLLSAICRLCGHIKQRLY